MLDKVFMTGCDKNTEWQLPWFIDNYQQYNDTPLIVADFGMSAQMIEQLKRYDGIEVFNFESTAEGWFKKPRAIWEATYRAHIICWLDTDCQVMGDISDIFSNYEEGKLHMVEDRPWTKRRNDNGAWYNSGVVMSDRNWNLRNWLLLCEKDPKQGDQEVLHYSMSAIERLGVIKPLPHKYNTLRLDYIDGIDVKDPLIIHHTGQKGNDVIRGQMV